MTVVKIVEVRVDIAAVVDHDWGKLKSCGLDCGFSVVKDTEIWGGDGSVFLVLVDEGDFNVVGKVT